MIVAYLGPKQTKPLYWRDVRALAASALTQTADKERRYNPDVPQPWVEADKNQSAILVGMAPKPLKVDRVPAPKRRPYEHPYDDESGFDPRDGGKVGKQRVPKRKRVTGPARILSKKPSIDQQRVLKRGP